MNKRLKVVVVAIILILLSIKLNQEYCRINNSDDMIWFSNMIVTEATFTEEAYRFNGELGFGGEVIFLSIQLNDGINLIMADSSFPFSTGTIARFNFILNFPIVGTGQEGNHTMIFGYETECGDEVTKSMIVYFNSSLNSDNK